MPEPLSDAYLLEAEFRARAFSGAFTGTAGTLAADVLLQHQTVQPSVDV